MQLQRYLMRQQHLLQTSGLRVRSGATAPPMPPGGVNGSNGAQGASGGGSSEGDSELGGMSDAAEVSRTARRPQELQRSRTYIVQGGSKGCLPKFAVIWAEHPAISQFVPGPCLRAVVKRACLGRVRRYRPPKHSNSSQTC
jgi:hypothetical protein